MVLNGFDPRDVLCYCPSATNVVARVGSFVVNGTNIALFSNCTISASRITGFFNTIVNDVRNINEVLM